MTKPLLTVLAADGSFALDTVSAKRAYASVESALDAWYLAHPTGKPTVIVSGRLDGNTFWYIGRLCLRLTPPVAVRIDESGTLMPDRGRIV